MTPLFPAIKAELLVVAHADNTIRSTVAVHAPDVDPLTFYSLAIIQILSHAQASGVDPQHIIHGVVQLAAPLGPPR